MGMFRPKPPRVLIGLMCMRPFQVSRTPASSSRTSPTATNPLAGALTPGREVLEIARIITKLLIQAPKSVTAVLDAWLHLIFHLLTSFSSAAPASPTSGTRVPCARMQIAQQLS